MFLWNVLLYVFAAIGFIVVIGGGITLLILVKTVNFDNDLFGDDKDVTPSHRLGD